MWLSGRGGCNKHKTLYGLLSRNKESKKEVVVRTPGTSPAAEIASLGLLSVLFEPVSSLLKGILSFLERRSILLSKARV